MARSETEESSLDSVIVIISLVTMNSSASNHLDKRLLLFHVHSQTALPDALERGLLFCGLSGTVIQLFSRASEVWLSHAAEAPSEPLIGRRTELIADDP